MKKKNYITLLGSSQYFQYFEESVGVMKFSGLIRKTDAVTSVRNRKSLNV